MLSGGGDLDSKTRLMEESHHLANVGREKGEGNLAVGLGLVNEREGGGNLGLCERGIRLNWA